MDRRVKRTEKAIKESFLVLAESNEINKIMVSEIEKLSDINRKTFYFHYTDVFAVLDEIEMNILPK